MIIEGLIATLNHDGSPHLTAMGPKFNSSSPDTLLLRPYEGSTTLKNLQREKQGVFHLTDDVELMVRAALGRLASMPVCQPAKSVRSVVMPQACQWLEFVVERMEGEGPRYELECRIVHRGMGAAFRGMNRARHAILEAAISATRITLLPLEDIVSQVEQLRIAVLKTAGPCDIELWNWLLGYIMEEARAQGLGNASLEQRLHAAALGND